MKEERPDGPGHPSSLILHPSLLLRASAILYLLHILLQGKVALLELFAFFTIFPLCWAWAKGEVRVSFHILYFPLFLYGFASTLSAFFAERRIHQGYEGMLWFKMLIFPAAVILLREVPRLRQLAVHAHAVFAGGIATWGLLEFVFLDRRDLEHRINGPAAHVMTFSGLVLPLSLMFLVLWWRERKWWQLAVTLVSSLALLLTFTRSVWIGWLAAALVVVLLTRARLAFYAVPALLLFLTFMPLDLFSRLISVFDMNQSSNFDRVRMLEAGAEMIRDEPLLGVGPANVKDSYALYRKQDAPRPRPPHLHNNIVQVWAERGILGLLGYLLLLALFLRECILGWHTPRRMWAEIGIAVTVSLAVAGLFEFNFGDTEVFYLLLNLMALVVVQLERPEPAANEAPLALVEAA
jgi:O-antigen ligase